MIKKRFARTVEKITSRQTISIGAAELIEASTVERFGGAVGTKIRTNMVVNLRSTRTKTMKIMMMKSLKSLRKTQKFAAIAAKKSGIQSTSAHVIQIFVQRLLIWRRTMNVSRRSKITGN